MCGERKKREKPQRQHRFRESCSCRRFLPYIGPVDRGLGIHGFLHTAPFHFLKESLVKNTLPPPDLPLWMYGYIEYLILKIEEGCTCDTRELAQVPELLGGGFRRAYGSRKILGNAFSRPIPLYFLHFWVCLAARKLTCFRFFGQKDAREHAVPHSESGVNSCNADR